MAEICKLENRRHKGFQLYEAIFHPPVHLQSGTSSIIFTRSGCGYHRVIRGRQVVQNEDVTITINNFPWFFIVGFKLKSST